MRPLFEASYQTILYTGKLGTALIPKVLSNMLCCVHLLAMGESLLIGKFKQLVLRALPIEWLPQGGHHLVNGC